MLEVSRLKPMSPNYDEKMFNRLYNKTFALRKKLASGIDSRRFGLQFDDVLSFFDVKFIFVFNKYHEKFNEEVLLGHLINSLKLFKYRIIRNAYTNQFSQSITAFDSLVTFEDCLIEQHTDEQEKDFYYNRMMGFMKQHLSMNAYTLLELQLNPPPYILSRINKCSEDNLQKIPDEVMLDYLDLGQSEKAYKFLNSMKKEIRNAVAYCKENFKAS